MGYVGSAETAHRMGLRLSVLDRNRTKHALRHFESLQRDLLVRSPRSHFLSRDHDDAAQRQPYDGAESSLRDVILMLSRHKECKDGDVADQVCLAYVTQCSMVCIVHQTVVMRTNDTSA